MNSSTNTLFKSLDDILKPIVEEKYTEEKQEHNIGVRTVARSNVVSGDRLKEVQLSTLKELSEYLAKTYGPMGSYTELVLGNTPDASYSKYSKDGLTVLKHIYYDQPIETTIQSEIEEICRYVDKTVGDGTTSAVILSYYIFKSMLDIQKKHKVMPRMLMQRFTALLDIIKSNIEKDKKEITMEDIYDIAMVSTNGNKEVSDCIYQIYQEHGFDVDITVSISNDTDNKVKEYDGITIDEGFSDRAYVNNLTNGTVEIHNAHVYFFADPADDVTMISLFEKILRDNILGPISNKREPIPTVIMCPRLSRDSMGMLQMVVSTLYQYDAQNITNQKPPVLIVTNYLGADEGVAYDISRLCGAKEIHKYINPEHEKNDIEAGLAATLENVHEFAGYAELVVADENRTKFINPKAMVETPAVYDSLIQFLESSIIQATNNNEEKIIINRLKQRLRRLKTNNVEYFIGGIAISDRDSLRDLVIDAVRNCRSAATHGVGRAANYEGLLHTLVLYCDCRSDVLYMNTLHMDILKGIFQAYWEATKILYGTVSDNPEELITESIRVGHPIDVARYASGVPLDKMKDEDGFNIRCSIRTDIEVLNAIEKIVGLMVTSNQCILQSTTLNRY